MKEFPTCCFLTTAFSQSDEDSAPSDLRQQYNEFLDVAQDFLLNEDFFSVYDTLDTLLEDLKDALSRKKRACQNPDPQSHCQNPEVSGAEQPAAGKLADKTKTAVLPGLAVSRRIAIFAEPQKETPGCVDRYHGIQGTCKLLEAVFLFSP